METFWNSLIYVATVLFFSAVIIVREWLSARLQKNVQIEFDAKLESVKAEFQKQLDEHRTQFNYWHMEQSSAMKKSFEDICDLYSNQKYLQMVETAPTWKENKNQETARSILKEKIILSLDEAAQGWLKARLFLEDKDDVKVGAFHLKTGNLFYYLFNPENPKSIEIIEKNREEVLQDLETIMENLRKSFQNTLRYYSAQEKQISCSQEPLI